MVNYQYQQARAWKQLGLAFGSGEEDGENSHDRKRGDELFDGDGHYTNFHARC